MSAVVERIEKYTTRERERLEFDDDTPPMVHIRVRAESLTHGICGARLHYHTGPTSSGIPTSKSDCVVCRDLAKRRGLL